MGHSPKRKPTWRNPAQAGYAAESPFPCWPLGFHTSTHINKLMIIAKKKNHTQTYKQVEGQASVKDSYIITLNMQFQSQA